MDMQRMRDVSGTLAEPYQGYRISTRPILPPITTRPGRPSEERISIRHPPIGFSETGRRRGLRTPHSTFARLYAARAPSPRRGLRSSSRADRAGVDGDFGPDSPALPGARPSGRRARPRPVAPRSRAGDGRTRRRPRPRRRSRWSGFAGPPAETGACRRRRARQPVHTRRGRRRSATSTPPGTPTTRKRRPLASGGHPRTCSPRRQATRDRARRGGGPPTIVHVEAAGRPRPAPSRRQATRDRTHSTAARSAAWTSAAVRGTAAATRAARA